MPVNEYFHAHPEQILGNLTANGTMRSGKPEITVESNGGDIASQLRSALANLQIDRQAWENGLGSTQAKAEAVKDRVDVPENLRNLGQGRLILHDDRLWIRNGPYLDLARQRPVTGRDADRVKGWMQIRDAVMDLKGLEKTADVSDGTLADEAAAKPGLQRPS